MLNHTVIASQTFYTASDLSLTIEDLLCDESADAPLGVRMIGRKNGQIVEILEMTYFNTNSDSRQHAVRSMVFGYRYLFSFFSPGQVSALDLDRILLGLN